MRSERCHNTVHAVVFTLHRHGPMTTLARSSWTSTRPDALIERLLQIPYHQFSSGPTSDNQQSSHPSSIIQDHTATPTMPSTESMPQMKLRRRTSRTSRDTPTHPWQDIDTVQGPLSHSFLPMHQNSPQIKIPKQNETSRVFDIKP